MRTNDKKDWAKLLFLRENMTQKEIAAKTGITEKTMSKWIALEKWEKLKQSIILTKEEQLRSLYMQLEEQNTAIKTRPEGQRFADSKEADARLKTITSINLLETESSLADIIDVSKKIINYLRPIDIEKAKDVCGIFDNYIRDALRK